MTEPNFTNPNYDSDESYDEQDPTAQEFDYSADTFPLVPKREPDWPQGYNYPSTSRESASQRAYIDFNADDFDSEGCLQQIKTEGRSDDLPPARPLPKLEEYTPRSGYTWDEMTPTVRDPVCRSTTALACFWPVYVGNFRCENHRDDFECVKEYFAWKGLHVRWWYRRFDEYYDVFQSKAKIFDMLVYFVSEQDAIQAIRQCHRDTYKGHPLNVFPGRVPVYFDRMRSLQAFNMTSGIVFSELFFEQHLQRFYNVNVACAVKFSAKHGAMEFASVADKTEALKCVKFKFEDIPEQLQKQRFLECDLLNDIEAQLTYNPMALQANRDDRYVKLLLANKRPQVNPNPMREVTLRGWLKKEQGQMNRLRNQREMKLKSRIIRAFKAGREPQCREVTKEGRKQFNKMVQKVKQARKG